MVEKNFLMIAPSLMASFCSAQEKPNVVLIMVGDMGYSDVGCYGGETLTPNIDALASRGVHFTQFYNASRSCPARVSLVTGLYQHQTDTGQTSEDSFKNPGQKSPNGWSVPGCKGFLNRNCVTVAEVLKEGGYHTYMTGKQRLRVHGEEKWPLQRGFRRSYGILAGICSYLRPSEERGLTLDNTKLPEPEAPYYTTDAFTGHAVCFVDEQKDDKPLFLYLASNTPHWPLQAKEEDIRKFTKTYRGGGWNEIREARRKRMAKLGIIDPNTEFAEWENRGWDELTGKEKDEVIYRMVVYAVQMHYIDYNVGRLLGYLKKNHKLDNTLVMFLSSDDAYVEPYAGLGGGKVSEINNPACSVFPSHRKAWTQVSSTPFRRYRCRSYEGDISTPLTMSWKSNLKNKKGEWCCTSDYLPNIMPTILRATRAAYPEIYHGGNKMYPLMDSSLFPAIQKKADSIHEYMYWEHQNNRVIRRGSWKAIRDEKGREQELYDVVKDRTGRNNLAEQHPEVLTKLVTEWKKWTNSNFVLPKHPKR